MGYAYSVSVRLSVANLASQGIRLIAKDLLGAHSAAVSLQSKLSALKLAAVGYGLTRAGEGIFHGLEKTVSVASEYTKQLSLMNAAGMSHAEIASSIAAAWQTSGQVLTSTAAGNLKQLRELRSVFGTQHMSEAYAILPSVMRTQAVLEALTGKRDERLGFQMAKVAELRQTGIMTLPFLQRNMDELSKTLMAMGGTLNVNDFLMTLKYAKTAGLSLSDRFVYDFLPTFMQEVKGGGGFMGNTSTAGTSVMRLYTQIVQGMVKKAAIPVWMEMGLIHGNDIVRNATGGFQIRPGGVAGAQLFAQDPLAWVEKFTPAINAFATRHHLTQLQAITSMGLPQNAAWALSTMMLKDAQFRRDQQLISSTPMPIESYNRLLKTNPQLAQQALDSQWYNVLTVVGTKILPVLVPLMTSFAKDLNEVSTWMQKHPKVTEGLVIGLSTLTGALVVLGNVMMSRAVLNFTGLGPLIARGFAAALPLVLNPVGLTITAIAGIGFAAYELWKHWDAIRPVLISTWHGIESDAVKAWGGIRTDMGDLTGWMRHEWDELTHWFHHTSPGTPAVPGPHGASGSWSEPKVSYIAHRAPLVAVLSVPVHLDGQKIAHVVTKHQVKALNAPQTGTSIFDGRQALVPAGGI